MRLTILIFLFAASCSQKANDRIELSKTWRLEKVNDDSLYFTYTPSDAQVKAHFEVLPECYSDGWILCPYIKSARVVFVKSGQGVIQEYVMSDSATTIVRSFSWKSDQINIEFDNDYFIVPPQSIEVVTYFDDKLK